MYPRIKCATDSEGIDFVVGLLSLLFRGVIKYVDSGKSNLFHINLGSESSKKLFAREKYISSLFQIVNSRLGFLFLIQNNEK